MLVYKLNETCILTELAGGGGVFTKIDISKKLVQNETSIMKTSGGVVKESFQIKWNIVVKFLS